MSHLVTGNSCRWQFATNKGSTDPLWHEGGKEGRKATALCPILLDIRTKRGRGRERSLNFGLPSLPPRSSDASCGTSVMSLPPLPPSLSLSSCHLTWSANASRGRIHTQLSVRLKAFVVGLVARFFLGLSIRFLYEVAAWRNSSPSEAAPHHS